MKAKTDKTLNLKAIKNIAKEDPKRKLFGFLFIGLDVLASSLTTGELITFGLGLAGISSPLWIQILAAGIPLLLIGGAVAYILVVQAKRHRVKIAEKQAALTRELEELKKHIIDIIVEYTLLEKLAGTINESKLDKNQKQSFLDEVKSQQTLIIAYLQVSLDKINGNDYKDKLYDLLEPKNSDFICENLGNNLVTLDTFNLGLNALEQRIYQNEKAILPHSDKKLSHFSMSSEDHQKKIKRILKFAQIGALGFITGGWGAIGIGTLIAGSGAFFAVGWPVLFAIVAVGLIVGIASVLYVRQIEKRRQYIFNSLDDAKTQISNMSLYLAKGYKGILHSRENQERLMFYKNRLMSYEEDLKNNKKEVLKLCDKKDISDLKVNALSNVKFFETLKSEIRDLSEEKFSSKESMMQEIDEKLKEAYACLKKVRKWEAKKFPTAFFKQLRSLKQMPSEKFANPKEKNNEKRNIINLL